MTQTIPSSAFREDLTLIDSICIGSGRFLRSVLVPALVAADYHPVIVQTRGTSFLEFCTRTRTFSYQVDTVHYDGRIETKEIPYWGAGTLGNPNGKQSILDFLSQTEWNSAKPFVIGVGVTEAGLSNASTKAMNDLYDVLVTLSSKALKTKICVINTDNVSRNGTVLKTFMNELANDNANMQSFLKNSVVFHNTMVDRITSQREGSNGLVPRAEPTPMKALVLEDLEYALPKSFDDNKLSQEYGVVVRRTPGQLDADIALKLRVANGTHTAAAHTMALTGLAMTDVLSSGSTEANRLLQYLDALVAQQIIPGVVATQDFLSSSDEAQAVYTDWRRRLIHAHFGLSTFFITQNGAAKGGIRIGPTIRDLIAASTTIQSSTAFALAALLRFLTHDGSTTSEKHLYRGKLDPKRKQSESKTVVYADGLSYNTVEGWYTFRCDCDLTLHGETLPLPLALHKIDKEQPIAYESVIEAYLKTPNGGNLASSSDTHAFRTLVKAISTLYARMMAGDALWDILESLDLQASCESLVDGPYNRTTDFDSSRPLHYQKNSIPDDSRLLQSPIRPNCIAPVVVSEVASAIGVDLHTHLLPPTHGALCLWGIDELLTYHYLVAEYFITAPPSMTPESFYAQSKQQQANLVWKALFVDRSPISEACRGVITTCVALGLSREIQNRDLEAIREFYRKYRSRGPAGAEAFCEQVFSQAGMEYAVMTNIPFEPTETQHWRPTPKEYSSRFRSACRVDPLLAGKTEEVEKALKAAGYEPSLEGARQFLHDWCDTMKPEYLMAATPHDFVLAEEIGTSGSLVEQTGVNEEAMREPFAFANLVKPKSNNPNTNDLCGTECGTELPSVIDETSDFLSEVLMKVCEERDLPLALKIGAHRAVNPKLLAAGDGVVAFADAGVLARLCTRFPHVRFLATFLSRANQHEACVLASKFRNLHLYGCWWFCNNPSIIEEMTKMRIEMLGTAFTAQHSDSRVLDQLLYKWPHSRAILAETIAKEYYKLVQTGGWIPTRKEVRRDVRRWFRGSYEEFLSKSLV